MQRFIVRFMKFRRKKSDVCYSTIGYDKQQQKITVYSWFDVSLQVRIFGLWVTFKRYSIHIPRYSRSPFSQKSYKAIMSAFIMSAF